VVGAPGSPALPPRVVVIDVFALSGGRTWISGIASQGVHHRCFHVESMEDGTPLPNPWNKEDFHMFYP
jgi:hypothetical protein